MELRNELKALIAQNGATLKRVCEILSQKTGESYVGNNITNKLRRKTIKFEEVQEILDVLSLSVEPPVKSQLRVIEILSIFNSKSCGNL